MARKSTIKKRKERDTENTTTLKKGKSENCILKKYIQERCKVKCMTNQMKKNHICLQGNIEPKKFASIIAIQEQMVETRASKANIGLPLKRDKSRICRETK